MTCPMCKKKLRGLERECQSCKADVSLLVDYVENLAEGLARAEALTRAGELGEAVWAYLEVLEVDPDNAVARRQVGKVATAIRQFDDTAPGRRWLTKLHKQKRWARRMANAQESGSLQGWLGSSAWFALVLAAMLIGYVLGGQGNARPGDITPTTATTPDSSKKAGDRGNNVEPAGKPG